GLETRRLSGERDQLHDRAPVAIPDPKVAAPYPPAEGRGAYVEASSKSSTVRDVNHVDATSNTSRCPSAHDPCRRRGARFAGFVRGSREVSGPSATGRSGAARGTQ